MSFHEVRFPTEISRGAQGGPERRTDVVVLGSGYRGAQQPLGELAAELQRGLRRSPRSTRCMPSSRSSRSGAGGSTVFAGAITPTGSRVAPQAVPTRARSGDRHRRRGDGGVCSSRRPTARARAVGARDQEAGCGNGADRGRRSDQDAGVDFTVDAATGIGHVSAGPCAWREAAITAGFEFDVPVRFDTDKLEVSLSGFQHGAIPNIPIVEIRL